MDDRVASSLCALSAKGDAIEGRFDMKIDACAAGLRQEIARLGYWSWSPVLAVCAGARAVVLRLPHPDRRAELAFLMEGLAGERFRFAELPPQRLMKNLAASVRPAATAGGLRLPGPLPAVNLAANFDAARPSAVLVKYVSGI